MDVDHCKWENNRGYNAKFSSKGDTAIGVYKFTLKGKIKDQKLEMDAHLGILKGSSHGHLSPVS